VDIPAILKELHDEYEAVEQAIDSLERLAAGQGKRRGRPPVWLKRLAPVEAAPARKRGRPAKSKKPK
jgi:hypothetical protein